MTETGTVCSSSSNDDGQTVPISVSLALSKRATYHIRHHLRYSGDHFTIFPGSNEAISQCKQPNPRTTSWTKGEWSFLRVTSNQGQVNGWRSEVFGRSGDREIGAWHPSSTPTHLSVVDVLRFRQVS